MKELAKAPPASYWNEIRRHEESLYRETNVHAPVLYGVEALAVWESGAADGIDIHDRVGYYAESPLRKWRPRLATLATFNEPDIPQGQWTGAGEARILELTLPRGHERLMVYAAWLPLTWYGLSADSAGAQRKAKDFYKKAFQLPPTEADYEFAKQQFRKGASGIDRIRHPDEC
jgi:hypothetical protein